MEPYEAKQTLNEAKQTPNEVNQMAADANQMLSRARKQTALGLLNTKMLLRGYVYKALSVSWDDKKII